MTENESAKAVVDSMPSTEHPQTITSQREAHQFKFERRYDTLVFWAVSIATSVAVAAAIIVVGAFIFLPLMNRDVPVELQRALSYVVSVILGGLIGAAFMRNRK